MYIEVAPCTVVSGYGDNDLIPADTDTVILHIIMSHNLLQLRISADTHADILHIIMSHIYTCMTNVYKLMLQ